MRLRGRTTFTLVAVSTAIFTFGLVAHTQQTHYPKPTELPNPYRLVQGWPMLPKSMNAGRWGEVIRVHVASNGNIWVFHRCFNTVPPGHATCIGRGNSNPPILEFDPSRSEEHTSELQSQSNLVCRLLLEKKKKTQP